MFVVLFYVRWQDRIGHFLGFFDHSKKPLEMADYVLCPHEKITSRNFRISGTLL
jgi:hypothetical protein